MPAGGIPASQFTLRPLAAILLTGSLTVSASALAAPHLLTNGPGDGTVNVGVDGYGAFGSSIGSDAEDALYDPVGAIGTAGTTFESYLAIRFGDAGSRDILNHDATGSNPTVTGTTTSADSSFGFGGLSFSLNQSLSELMDGGNQVGSRLDQTYTITNDTQGELTFELIRYLDGDLQFDGSISDGGGRIVLNGEEILFETDTAAGTADSTTFVGIVAAGGSIPLSGRFEVDSYSGLRARIENGSALDDLIAGDGLDPDQFIDAGGGYDVTLALRNVFTLGAGGSTTYLASTIFGTGAPEDALPPVQTPEPAVLSLLGLGLLGLSAVRRRRPDA